MAGTDYYLRGMSILLDLDEQAGLGTLGYLHDWDEADQLLAFACEQLEVDPTDVPHVHACAVCGLNITRLAEYCYMLVDDVWNAAGLTGIVCIGCVETALGRELVRDDFDWSVPLTADEAQRSERLLDRMGA